MAEIKYLSLSHESLNMYLFYTIIKAPGSSHLVSLPSPGFVLALTVRSALVCRDILGRGKQQEARLLC